MKTFEVFEPQADIAAAINIVANHDAKAVSYVALSNLGETTIYGLANQVVEHTSVPECRGFVTSYPMMFEKYGFATMRRFVGESGQLARHYTATRQDPTLSVVGTFTEWSEDHDLSLIPFFSSSAGHDDQRSPVHTLQILDGLLNGRQPSQANLPGYASNSWGNVNGYFPRLNMLIEDGIVVVEEAANEFEIDMPVYRGRKPFEDLSPETQAAYRVLATAKRLEPDAKWTVDTLARLAEELLFVGADRESGLKRVLSLMSSNASPRYAPGAVKKIDIQKRRYSVASTNLEAVTDLVDKAKIINSAGQRKRTALANFAIDSYEDPETAARLVMRGVLNTRDPRVAGRVLV